MAAANFYNTNLNRAYPFLLYSVGQTSGPASIGTLIDAGIVDAGFRISAKARFADGADQVYLARIIRTGNTFFFEFESTAPELYNTKLVFTRNLADPDYAVEFVDSGGTWQSDSSLSYSSDECEEPLWSGFLVTGKMQSLDEWLPGNGTVGRASPNDDIVEPALVHNLSASYVTRVALANDDRTRSSAPAGCPAIDFPYPTGAVNVFERCLVGDIVFKAGYNADIRQNDAQNSITLGAAVGLGAGQPCASTPLFPDEVPPAGSNLLEGGLQCNQVLRSINGVGGRLLNIDAGLGVIISAAPDINRLIVDVNMSGLVTCFEQSRVSESC